MSAVDVLDLIESALSAFAPLVAILLLVAWIGYGTFQDAKFARLRQDAIEQAERQHAELLDAIRQWR